MIFVVTGPSGVGKSSLIAKLAAEGAELERLISITTRPPRPKERHGVDYFFVDQEEYNARLGRGEFVLSTEVHGHRYGIPKTFLEIDREKHRILDLNHEAARNLKRLYPQETVVVFLKPPSFDELRLRLCGRGTDSQGLVKKKLKSALVDLELEDEFDYKIVNHDLATAVAEFLAILRSAARSSNR